MSAEPPVLYHLKVSPYNEKVRWALDYKRVPHVRRAVVPGAHRRLARKLTGGSTLPVLVLGGRAMGESAQIIDALEGTWPERPLYPADPVQRRRALELEHHFDEQLGPYERMLLVHHILPDPALLVGTFAPGMSAPRRALARAQYPLLRSRLVAAFGIDERSVERAFAKLRAAGRRFQAEIQRSGYLVGDSFSVADLSLAAMVAPVACPEQFPYPQAQRDHPLLEPVRDALSERGLLDWAREIYARERPGSAEIVA